VNADAVKWDDRGLAPAVVVHAETGVVLMLGWMNREALAATASSSEVHFYSRSRAALWRKGETSGNTLAVRAVRLDCDADALVVEAIPAGPTCHTGAESCFYRRADGDDWADDGGPRGAPAAVLDRLYAVLESRRAAPAEKSYTASLLAGGVDKISAKIAEEQEELCAELRAGGPRDKIVHETADLFFHVLCGLLATDVAPGEVWRELDRRFGQSGHAEKAARK
jgi:phosphoribosyl-ATP pyrophosphohydrolase/phosphoribosyl-AMP cyclohydrolase